MVIPLIVNQDLTPMLAYIEFSNTLYHCIMKLQNTTLRIKTTGNCLKEAHVTIAVFKMHQVTMNRTSLMVCFDSNTVNEEQSKISCSMKRQVSKRNF